MSDLNAPTPPATVPLSEGLKLFMEAAGCRPLTCHCCSEPMDTGDEIGWHTGPMHILCHAKCRETDMADWVFDADTQDHERDWGEMQEASIAAAKEGLTIFEKVDGGWQTTMRHDGCAVTMEELLGLGTA